MIKFIDFLKKRLLLNSRIISLVYAAVEERIPVLLQGPPGTGKTKLTKVVADFLKADYVFYQCTVGTTEEDLIWRLIPTENTKSGIKKVFGPLPEALLRSKKRKVVLVLDEIDKTRPSVDAMLLDYLENYRISLNDEERVIYGNPENLWVFLTSNAERDFSEPLLRRVVAVKMELLTVNQMRELLRRYFKEELVDLLVRLYADTIKAGLRKPATIKELVRLGRAVERLQQNADWSDLVYAYVIKDEHEWERFLSYLEGGREETYQEPGSENDVDISTYYEGIAEDGEEEMKRGPRMPKNFARIEKVEEVEDKETFMKVKYGESSYDSIIKSFEPEPSDDPAIFGDFRVIRSDGENWIIKDKPCSLKDLIEKARLNNENVEKSIQLKEFVYRSEGQVYLKDRITIPKSVLMGILRKFTILYYTRDLVRIKNSVIDAVLKKVKQGKAVALWEMEAVVELGGYIGEKINKTLETLVLNAEKKALEELNEFVRGYEKREIEVDLPGYQSDEKLREQPSYRKLEREIERKKKELAEKYWVPLEILIPTCKVSIRIKYRDGKEGTVYLPYKWVVTVW